eukprot:3082460-Pleurochrysis_carterae.AAC.2
MAASRKRSRSSRSSRRSNISISISISISIAIGSSTRYMPGIVGVPSAALQTGLTALLRQAGKMERLQVPAPKNGMWLAPVHQLPASGGCSLLEVSRTPPLPTPLRSGSATRAGIAPELEAADYT